jgi:1-acyl-sn-glycerol-3-phosphate acyltransferase
MAKEKGNFWIGLCEVVLYPLTAALSKRSFVGMERIPQEGGTLLALNHVSHIDPIFDVVMLRKHGRIARTMAKASLFTVPIVGKVLTNCEQIPVYRGSTQAGHSLIEAEKALRNGKLVMIYPEGTCTKDPDGWPMRSRNGVARLALDLLDTDVKVIPAARWGTKAIFDGYAAKSTKKFRPFPRKKVDVSVGEPIDLSAYRGKEVTSHLLTEVTELIMRRVVELEAGLRNEPAPEGFYK